MFRTAMAVSTAGLFASCAVLPLPGYGGVIYLPQGRVELPREASLAECAAAVRQASLAENPALAGVFKATPSTAQLAGSVLGVCSGPGGVRHLVRPDDVQPGGSAAPAP